MVSKKTKPHRSKRVVFTKHQYEAFAKKLNKWTGALPPEERAIMIAALDRGLNVVRRAGDKSEYTATPINLEMTREFNLGQFIVEVLLALEGVSAEVDEDGPSYVQEIDWAKT
jgi:hypothetical protein